MIKARKNKSGFTLVELLVVISIIALLLGVLMPSMQKAKSLARSVICSSNLKQIGLGVDMYLGDYNRNIFPLVHYGTRGANEFGRYWYFGFEPVSSFSLPEGQRELDRKSAKLYRYIQQYDSVEICPAFPYRDYKPKFKTRWMTYGVNAKLSQDLRGPNGRIVSLNKLISAPQDVVLFADSAYINTHLPPATPSNPMLEEWHYISPGEPTVHFRHGGRANLLYCDGHVGQSDPEPDTFGPFLPEQKVGCLPDSVKFQ